MCMVERDALVNVAQRSEEWTVEGQRLAYHMMEGPPPRHPGCLEEDLLHATSYSVFSGIGAFPHYLGESVLESGR
ncbi:hypothetical protein CLOM_g10777 [Closterium sp. NIES-68]|nr:hypothetical protein CLOM_g10777 [Closterium sp. NIES-68]